MLRKLLSIALLLPLLAGALACRNRVVVRMTTDVYRDGSLDRRVEIIGRDSDGEVPTDDAWLEERVGIRLADPEAWKRVERGPGRLRAEGFFPRADDLPAVLTLQTRNAARPARTETVLELDHRVLLRRIDYIERHGDPYSAADSAAALDALVELAVQALRSELRDHFGTAVDSTPAESFLRNEARDLAQSLLDLNRAEPGWENLDSRLDGWNRALAESGVHAVETDDPDDYWESQTSAILDWGREQVAAALSTSELPILPDELSFWPRGEDHEEYAMEIAARVWGSEDELLEHVEPHLAALSGYYGGDDAPSIRFESRVRLPGTLLTTNGTPDGDSVVWLFRERDMALRERTLRARSVELQDQALIALGARRDLDTLDLVRLADLLWERDPDGGLVEALKRAVHEADIEVLRDEDALPQELILVAEELVELLDPDVDP